MTDETSSTRSVPPHVESAGRDGDLSTLRKELIEARNLVIKTDNLLKNLHAELKQMGRKHEEQEKRHWMTSVTAYIGFAVIAGAGAIAYANAEGKVKDTPYREKTSMKPFGPVENGSQVLFGLDYTQQIWAYRAIVVVVPFVVFFATRRVCRELLAGELVEAWREEAEAAPVD